MTLNCDIDLDLSGLQCPMPLLKAKLALNGMASTTTATIISSIQPVFGIIIAFFIVNEVPEINTIWGGLLIISTVLIETIRIKKRA